MMLARSHCGGFTLPTGRRQSIATPHRGVVASATVENRPEQGGFNPRQSYILEGGWNGQSGVRSEVEVPLAEIQQLPDLEQAAIVVGIHAGIAGLTYATIAFTDLGWTQSAALPIVQGALFSAAGVAHFTAHDQFATMMPTRGAWGLWYLPGSDRFHVNWSGVAEVAGGVGLLASCVPPVADALPWLRPASALGLFALTAIVTPANVFMLTHNAPGPGPPGAVIPPLGHAVRLTLQALILTTFWGMAFPPA